MLISLQDDALTAQLRADSSSWAQPSSQLGGVAPHWVCIAAQTSAHEVVVEDEAPGPLTPVLSESDDELLHATKSAEQAKKRMERPVFMSRV